MLELSKRRSGASQSKSGKFHPPLFPSFPLSPPHPHAADDGLPTLLIQGHPEGGVLLLEAIQRLEGGKRGGKGAGVETLAQAFGCRG